MTDTTVQMVAPYPARLRIDYKDRLDRGTTLVRILWIIPIAIILILATGGFGASTTTEQGERTRSAGASIALSLSAATALMIVFRQRYPRWWFDFQLALARFATRVGAYFFLLRDEYPSTEDEQAVHLELDYPNVERDLNRWMPLVKWLLAIPHYIVLFVLFIFAVIALIVAWFAILITSSYPRGLFDFIVGVLRWTLRVQAYAFLLLTDRYPPFSLD